MILLGWAVIGAVMGVAGSEVLRLTKPELVQKVEDAAKRVADSICASKSDDASADDQADKNKDT